jgi:hypothetical protein
MHIIESNTITYMGCLFFIYCFFSYTPALRFLKNELVKYRRKIENNAYYIVYGKMLEDVAEEETRDAVPEPVPEVEVEVKPINYEDKYSGRFLTFPNEYHFTESELDQEKTNYAKIKSTYETNMKTDTEKIRSKIDTLERIITNFDDTDAEKKDKAIRQMIQYFGIKQEYNDDPDDYDIDELFNDVKNDCNQFTSELTELTNAVTPDFVVQAKEAIINSKLDGYINNYILETTPIGNVYMRYNNNKKSFEYFSNSTIPYRYLETISRKYVMTYWCKPLFIDLAEELKKAKEKHEEEKNNKKDKDVNDNNTKKDKNNTPLNMGPNKFKKYTKDVQQNRPSKNRVQSDFILPPQIKANLPNINATGGDEHLLKACSNRYTWEGRIANLSLLKKVDKKLVDKKMAMSFADFKLLRQNASDK